MPKPVFLDFQFIFAYFPTNIFDYNTCHTTQKKPLSPQGGRVSLLNGAAIQSLSDDALIVLLGPNCSSFIEAVVIFFFYMF